MKGFIEVTNICDNGEKNRLCLPVSEIKEVIEQPNGTAEIVLQRTQFKNSASINFVPTVETYSEVIEKIAQALA